MARKRLPSPDIQSEYYRAYNKTAWNVLDNEVQTAFSIVNKRTTRTAGATIYSFQSTTLLVIEQGNGAGQLTKPCEKTGSTSIYFPNESLALPNFTADSITAVAAQRECSAKNRPGQALFPNPKKIEMFCLAWGLSWSSDVKCRVGSKRSGSS